eukprot:GHVS01059395.1.p1 GENE.GHVS01059395.1~~GHVS01059395.1.p1  ORF type:complete len:176 (+),score=35.33 GHVS01059395.1:309-836(+)
MEQVKAGVMAASPLTDIRITVVDGSHHEVDSTEMAFKIAAAMAVREAAKLTKPTLLEPIMKVVVSSTSEYMGAVIGDLCSRRGQVGEARLLSTSLLSSCNSQQREITAFVPLSSLFGYTTVLRSITQGRASFSMKVDHYSPVPPHLVLAIICQRTGKTMEQITAAKKAGVAVIGT